MSSLSPITASTVDQVLTGPAQRGNASRVDFDQLLAPASTPTANSGNPSELLAALSQAPSETLSAPDSNFGPDITTAIPLSQAPSQTLSAPENNFGPDITAAKNNSQTQAQTQAQNQAQPQAQNQEVTGVGHSAIGSHADCQYHYDDDDDDDDDDSSSDQPNPGHPANGAQLIQDWNQLALDLCTAASRGPTISSRVYALVNAALYDAWAAFDKEAQGSIVDLQRPLGQPSEVRTVAAMATAAHDVLVSVGATLFAGGILPTNLLQRADALLLQAFEALPSSWRGQRAAAVAQDIGQQVGAGINAWANLDGANQAGNYTDTTGYTPAASVFDPNAPIPTIDSNWQPLTNAAGVTQKALTPHWGQVVPFAIGSGAALVPDSILTPYDANGQLNPAFVAELNQVLNFSMNLTAEQKAIAEFWEQGPGSSFPPGLWMAFTNQLIGGQSMGLEQAMKLSFGVSQALFDASIAAWATKYTFDSVRPITAMRQLYFNQSVGPDGMPLSDWRGAPILGQEWQPYQNPNALTPNFPDLPSGHSTYSTAAAGVLRNLLGSNVFGQSVTLADSASRFDPNGFDGVAGSGDPITLSWATFSQAAEQAGLSRLLGGIHFNDGNLQGQIIGAQVGAITNAKLDLLFNSSPVPSQTASQLFGTMEADILDTITAPTGLQEIYGFGGNDLLIGGGNGTQYWDLFGGDGVDSFLIKAGGSTLVRDYQIGETIKFDASLLPMVSDLSAVQISNSVGETAQAFTHLSFNGQALVGLDGVWNIDQLSLGFDTSPLPATSDLGPLQINNSAGEIAQPFTPLSPINTDQFSTGLA